LDVVNVWEVPEILVPATVAFSCDADALERASRTLLERMADSLDDELGGKAPDVQLRSVAGTPANVLIEAARDAYLLVVGSRGLGGFRGLMLGSVSQQCTLHAPCPTVVVHQPAGEGKA
jgi:nucleotide-binding universal stress UspA family protein